MRKRVVVVGLDGMAWHVLDRLFEYNAMPYLKRASNSSMKGVLGSTIPPLTGPAWTSIASGVNPGKHGIYSFLTHRGDYASRLVTSWDVRYPRIHEMVSLKGLKSVCVNHPFTYPIIRIGTKCKVISDWLGPKKSFYPESLKEFAKNYPICDPMIWNGEEDSALEILHRETEERVETVNSMMQRLDWDLFWVVFNEPDQIFHRCYAEVFEGHKQITGILRKLDKTIKLALDLADLMVVVSDHGFARYTTVININGLLNELGLIAKSREKIIQDRGDLLGIHDKAMYISTPPRLHSLLSREPLKSIIKKISRQFTGKEFAGRLFYIDPFKSKAFVSPHHALGIHVKDQNVFDLVFDELKKLDFVAEVWKRQDVYEGPYVKDAPEIVFVPHYDNRAYFSESLTRVTSELVQNRSFYSHHPNGIILIHANEIPRLQIEHAETPDVVPTVLSYLKLPMPSDTDGTPLFEEKTSKRYDYSKHWRLVKQVQIVKRKLAKQGVSTRNSHDARSMPSSCILQV